MIIYHFFSYENFKWMIDSKSLYFVNPLTKWSDKKEGFLFRNISEKYRKNGYIEKGFIVKGSIKMYCIKV